MSGSIIAGNFPSTEINPYINSMCLLDETMSDNTIISKLKAFISLSNNDYNNIINNSYQYTKNNLLYSNGILALNNIIDSMDNNIISTLKKIILKIIKYLHIYTKIKYGIKMEAAVMVLL